eukprot:scaffold2092_cov275-Prasinococcus_capsulatus_cf.AAC.3
MLLSSFGWPSRSAACRSGMAGPSWSRPPLTSRLGGRKRRASSIAYIWPGLLILYAYSNTDCHSPHV